MPTRDYSLSLNDALADPDEAAAYLSACLDEGPAEFLVGLLDVARARGELESAATTLGVSPSALAEVDPRQPFSAVADLAQSLGVRLTCSAAR
jgi:DNA-binding phage protein